MLFLCSFVFTVWTLRTHFASNETFYRRLWKACTFDIRCLCDDVAFNIESFSSISEHTDLWMTRGKLSLGKQRQFSAIFNQYVQYHQRLRNSKMDILGYHTRVTLSRLLDNIALYYVMSSRIESAICGLLYPVSMYSIARIFFRLKR